MSAEDFGARLRQVMSEKGLKNSDLARATGLSPQLVSEYVAGKKVAGADNLFSMADALGALPRWLIRGEGPQSPDPTPDDEGLIALPLYDAHGFSEYGLGRAVEEISVPRQLIGSARTTTGLWLTEMPTDALPSVAAEGQLIICRPPEQPLQDRKVYVLLLGGRTIVRRVFVRPEGLLLKGDDEADSITIRPDDIDTIMPVGRVLGPIGLGPN